MKIKIRKIPVILLLLTLFLFLFVRGDRTYIPFFSLIFLYLISFIIVFVSGRKIEVNPFIYEDDGNLLVNVEIENLSFIPVAFIKTEILIENLLTGELNVINFGTGVYSKRKTETFFKIDNIKTGTIRVKVKRILIYGFFQCANRNVEIDKEVFYTVLPNIKDINNELPEFYSYNMESFKYAENKKGNDPGEIFGINDYKKGDSIKSIHWKLTGKLGKPVVREMGYPIEDNLIILLDKFPNDCSAENIAELTNLFISLSYTFILRDIKHSVGWYDKNQEKFVTVKIEEKNSFLNRISGALKVPGNCTNGSTANTFISFNEKNEYSRIIIVGDHKEVGEELLEYGNISVFTKK